MKILREGILNIYDLNNNEVISAREIYNKLNINRDFPTWIRSKIKSLNLIENIDYATIAQKREERKRGRTMLEHFVSLNAALAIINSMRMSGETLELSIYLAAILDYPTDEIESKQENEEVQLGLELEEIGIANNKPNENPISAFTDEVFGTVRMVLVDGKPHAVATDIAKALGYKNTTKAIYDHCRYITKSYIPHPQNVEKGMVVNVIPEPDIFRLIMNSKLPSAERFEAWVVEDIIPSVLKNGFYATAKTVEAFLNDPDAAIKIFENYKKEREEKERLLKEKADNEHKVFAYEDFINSDNSYNFAIAAKMLSIPRTPYSNEFVGKNTLLAWLRRDGILISSNGEDRNTPYQKYVNRGWFDLVVNLADGKPKGSPTVRVTPKGIEGLYKKYRYSNMPKTIDIDNIKNNVTLNDEEHLDIAL